MYWICPFSLIICISHFLFSSDFDKKYTFQTTPSKFHQFSSQAKLTLSKDPDSLKSQTVCHQPVSVSLFIQKAGAYNHSSDWVLDGGSPMSHVDFKKWQCSPVALFPVDFEIVQCPQQHLWSELCWLYFIFMSIGLTSPVDF